MHDLLVDGHTEGSGEHAVADAVPFERGHCVALARDLLGDAIELERSDAGAHLFPQSLQHLGDDSPCPSHARDVFLGFELELHHFVLRSP